MTTASPKIIILYSHIMHYNIMKAQIINWRSPLKKTNLEELFLSERLMKNVALISVISGIISLIMLLISDELELMITFEMIVKILITLLTLWAFSKFHWNVMQGLMGALLFALLYQEGFLVLEKLWGETSDFDAFLIMGVQGSLFLAAQSMSFLMTIIIIINHFVIDYSRIGNYGNVVFNQISIVFKISLYIFLMIINSLLNYSIQLQIISGFEYLSDLCIVILIICIETQLDNFKAIRQDLLNDKKKKEVSHE